MSCILTMKTADLSVLEDLLHRFDRALNGCSQHRNRFSHRLQYCKTIDPETQASLGGHLICCSVNWVVAGENSTIDGGGKRLSQDMLQAPMSALRGRPDLTHS
jgi:hypothetical protein